MTLSNMDEYFRSFLHFDNYAKDPSKNGIQVQNSKPQSKEISKVAFAVDACTETIQKAVENKVQALVVHHGLFWGHEQTITANHYDRLRLLIENDIALYACHIPLDANEEVGNNYGLARQLCLENLQEFGVWGSMTIGVQGSYKTPVTIDSVLQKLLPQGVEALSILNFGKKEILSVAIVSGGAADLLPEAIEKNIDLYITGEVSHESYHSAKEAAINVIAGGHYNTETVGVSLLSKKLNTEKGIETIFIDAPTGL